MLLLEEVASGDDTVAIGSALPTSTGRPDGHSFIGSFEHRIITPKDNSGKTFKHAELCNTRAVQLVFLPAYSPDFKWDEKAEIMLR
jgi:hypothetical protein